MIDVSAAPFNLDADAAEWVNTTLAGMDLRAKVGHLFHLVCRVNAPIPMLLSADVERGANGLYVGEPDVGRRVG